jgi:hypothetical protein
MFCFGPYGLRASEVNCCSYPYGRMGQDTILAKPHRLRIRNLLARSHII